MGSGADVRELHDLQGMIEYLDHINRNIEYDGILWLWAVLYFLGGFACLEVAVQKLMGNTLSKIKASVRAFAQQRFGKK